jgi:hypothetical protein
LPVASSQLPESSKHGPILQRLGGLAEVNGSRDCHL